MEAVPRLPMLSFELKVSPDNVEFAPKLKQYIRDHYNEDPDAYSGEIHELEGLRASAVRASRDFTGCSTLKKYYCQLHFLQSRFPMGENQQSAASYSWCDLYSSSVYNTTDIKYEMACVLYNIGALHTELGALDARNTPDGMKISCTHFQCAAWAFQHLRENFPQSRDSDLSPTLLTFMYNLSLAQAQECILEKSMTDNRKPTIIAKVATQVVEYLKSAHKTIDANKSQDVSVIEIVGPRLIKMWKRYCDFKMTYYNSVALLYQGMQAEEQQKMGERLAYYQAAMDRLSEANKLSKNLEKQDEHDTLSKSSQAMAEVDAQQMLEESLTFTLDVLGGKFTAAQKENEFVYHEKVPPATSLIEVKGASLVKGIPFSVTDPEVSGGDIFSKLVPMEAHQASSMYSEEKAKLLRRVGSMIQEKNEELEMYLASMQLESLSLDADNEAIPQELIESCAELCTQKGIQILTDAMAKISNHYHDIDATLGEIQKILKDEEEKGKEFSNMMGKRAPNMILGELKREANKYCEAHKSVQDNNTTLHKAIKHHMVNLQLLSQPLDKVVAALPSTANVEASGDTAAKHEVQRLLGKVDEMRKQRQNFEGQLRTNLQTDDVTKQLVTQQDEMEEFFRSELKKHEKIVGLLEQNMTAQGNILQALSEANAAYATTRRQTDQIMAQRRSFIDSLLASYFAYKDILTKAQDAQDFYEKLEGQVNKLISRVKSVCRVQDEEREEMLNASVKKFTTGLPGAPAATIPCPTDQVSSSTSGPKLKDYLQHMKGGAKGVPGAAPGMPPPAPTAHGHGSYTSNMRPAPVGSEQTEVVPSCSTSQAAASGYGSAYQTPTSAFPPSAPSPAPSPAPQGSPLKHGGQYYPQSMPSLQHPPAEGATTSAPSSQYQYGENYRYYGYEYPAGVGAQPGTMPASYPHPPVSTVASTLPQSPSLSQAPGTTTASSVAGVSSGGQNIYPAHSYSYAGAPMPNSTAYQATTASATGTYQQPSYQSHSNYYAPQHSGVAATRVSSPVPKDSRQSDTNKFPSAYQYPDGIQGYVGQRNYPSISNPVYSQSNIYSQGLNTFTSQADGSKGYGGPVTFQTASTSVTSTVQTGPSIQSQNAGYPPHFNQPSGTNYVPQVSTGYSAPFAGRSNQMYGNGYGGRQEAPVAAPIAVPTTSSTVTSGNDNPYAGAPHNLSYSMAGGSNLSGAQTNVSQSPNNYFQGGQQKENQSASYNSQQQQPHDYSGYSAQYNWSQYGYSQSNVASAQPAQGQQQYPQPHQAVQGQQQFSQPHQTQRKQQYPQQQYQQPQQPQGQQQYPLPKQQQYSQPHQGQSQLQYPQSKQTQAQQPFQAQQLAQGQQYPQSHQVPPQQYSQPQQIQGQQYPQPQQASGQQIPQSQQRPQQHAQQPLPTASTSTVAASASPAGGISNLDLLSGIEMSAPTTQWSPLTPQPAGSSSAAAPTSSSGGPSSTPDLTSTASSKPNVAGSGLPNVVSSVGEKKASVPSSSPVPVPQQEPHDTTPVATSTILDLQAIKKSVPSSTKPIATNPLTNDETLSKLAMETERFSKMVEGLDRKSLNGPTNLELKWKEVTDALDRECAQYKVSVARCYPLKNRYADILPFDHTRVQLSSERDDYINASHVAMKKVSESFPLICTQAPLPSTFGDFWSLIWEQQAELVVCLNTEAELKGQLYWPNQRGASLTFGALSISLQSYKDGSSWCQRVLQLTNHNTKLTRVVIHMQFLAWPPSAMPENPAPLLQFMAEVHNFQRQQRNKTRPVVIQCISGIGRSGVFVVLSAFMKDVQTTGTLSDLQTLVVVLCCQRRNGIQDKDHLYFLYKATLYHTQDILMKRGILTNKATFEEGPREKTHVRHPSADLLSTCDLSRLQVKLGLGTASGDEDGQGISKEPKDKQHSRSGSSASLQSTASHSSASADAADGVTKSSQGSEAGTPPTKSFLKLEPSQTLPPNLAASIDPQLFRIEPVEPSKKTKITKEDFEHTKGGIRQGHDDPSDPFSTIDPLWSLKKT
ncbi:tyrosine-protein phosphatase non-receptor type protein myopic isoform X2 [Oratosquilla oratoria]|uniref:tyrosine-protein phosphatase non-receptor type protein myopic isoform X2 n=1 Tax=Oratosquilla oratoria TaxID=337810 RepID=UPI003F75F042